MEKIKRINRELKYRGAILEIYSDTMQMPGERTVQWDFIEHNGASAVIPVMDDGRILMVRQYRNALERETLEIPAGKVDFKDEPKLECAMRELEEETGYRTNEMEHLMDLTPEIAFCNELISIYVARNLIPSRQHLDEDEFLEIQAYDLPTLLRMIWNRELTDAKTVAALLAYQIKYKV